VKPIQLYSEAESEMIDASKYYELQQNDLGKRFIEVVRNAVKRVQINPLLYPRIISNIRTCQTKTFPYHGVFRDQEKQNEIIAIMHTKRNPGYWRNRL